MWLLVFIGVALFIILVVVTLLPEPDLEGREGCEEDIPCQECGRCYGDHINAMGISHTYRYPRDLHR